MNDENREKIKVIFSQSHSELLSIVKDEASESQVLSLHRLLTSLNYEIAFTTKILTSDQLMGSRILVLGAPQNDLAKDEVGTIKEFVEQGGGLLIISNSKILINPLHRLNELAGIAGLEIQEYLNYPPTTLQKFQPHYITANLKRVKVGNVASVIPSNGAYPLAFTKAAQQPIIGCANVGLGRVVAIGDADLFTDELITDKNNETLVANTFRWLAVQNIIDVEEIIIPKTVNLGQSVAIELKLKNIDPGLRPQIECTLESDADAIISEPAKKKRTIPPGVTTILQWTIKPQILGDQKLRLTICVNEQTSLFFDQLSEMCCLAPGYLTLEIKDETGTPKTNFNTEDRFTATGIFHWASGLAELSYNLDLDIGDGLIKRECQLGISNPCWLLQATARGTHKLELKIIETGQSFAALVEVSQSTKNKLTEIKAAYVDPLDAEIAARLKQVDECLVCDEVREQPFELVTLEKFVDEVYKEYSAAWLQEVLKSAHREKWNNPDLLDLVLTYISPTYLTNRGSFIPYGPKLASHLAQLHPNDRRYLEYNLLCSEESEDVNIKQNIAAYLLHEKYGHGFFYTQTRLGQQLALLQKYGYLNDSDDRPESKASKLLKDSAIIVNEGFAAWMELTFLSKLDREVRQAVYPRQIILIDEATGLNKRQLNSEFFEAFSPRYDSKYREGFEYLEFISRKFNLRCAVQAFLIATNIDFGITENTAKQPPVAFDAEEIYRKVLDPSIPDWRSHSRLRKIAELLYEHDENAEALVRNQNCPIDCHLKKCPLEEFIKELLKWRTL